RGNTCVCSFLYSNCIYFTNCDYGQTWEIRMVRRRDDIRHVLARSSDNFFIIFKGNCQTKKYEGSRRTERPRSQNEFCIRLPDVCAEGGEEGEDRGRIAESYSVAHWLQQEETPGNNGQEDRLRDILPKGEAQSQCPSHHRNDLRLSN